MAILVTLKGPNEGRQFDLDRPVSEIGRHLRSDICLESQAVSRYHARIHQNDDKYFIEDLGSSNGTFLNGKRIVGRIAFSEQDTLQLGPYSFVLRYAPVPTPTENELVICSEVKSDPSDSNLIGNDPARKLEVILGIAQHLARTLDLEQLLGKLLDQLMLLFPIADRGMVLLCEGTDRFVVRAQRFRRDEDGSSYPFSRTIVRRALDDGVGVLSSDVRSDDRFQTSSTLTLLDMRSLLCVPMIGQNGRQLGVIQLDRFRRGKDFLKEDLQLLTAVGLQMAMVLENVALHAELLREERLHQEVALARDIQEGFLPIDFPSPEQRGYELFARIQPAREVSGDLYDFFTLKDGRMSFFVGDVSGKGMPAALFMVAVRYLGRYLASGGDSPAETLRKLNEALSADNPSAMFVTLVHGIYDPLSGQLVMASGGHPSPLLRRANGQVDVFPVATGRLLGIEGDKLGLSDTSLQLGPGETLILYTDGITEARTANGTSMFGVGRLRQAVGGARVKLSLKACADEVRGAVEQFAGSTEVQDDQTLLLLRRVTSA